MTVSNRSWHGSPRARRRRRDGYAQAAFKAGEDKIAARTELRAIGPCRRKRVRRVGFNADARELFLRFARDPATLWPGNFRDFGSAVRRLCTLAPRGRITRAMVEEEIGSLRRTWRRATADADGQLLADVLGEKADEIDPFDRVQLAEVIRTCRHSASLSEAGRRLFAVSRSARSTTNDADRLRKYLQRFGLTWAELGA